MPSTDWGGSKVPRLRQQLEARDGRTCWLCQLPISPDDTATVDHVKPRSAYPAGTPASVVDDLSNLRLAHLSCNSRRQASTTGAPMGDLSWLPTAR